MKLCETTKFMISMDYKDRFIAEYWQTKIRYEKLKTLNTKIELSMKYGIGDLMGSADIVPGVSGGTIALITGIYAHLVEAISKIRFGFLKPLFKGDINGFSTQLFEEIDLEEPSNNE